MFAKQTIVAALAIAFAVSGCATHKINYKNPTITSTGTTHSEKQSFFLWGLVGGNEIDLQRLCPTGVAGIQSKSSPGDSILTWVTAGLYSPLSVEVHCAASAPVAGGGA